MATKEDALPRFTYDMVMLLDAACPPVAMPRTPEGVKNFRENFDSFMWMAAQRAFVDDLKEALEEEEHERAEAEGPVTPEGEGDSALRGLAKVLDGSGEIRLGVPSPGVPVD